MTNDGSFVQTKTCTKCGETKPNSEFNKHASRKDGLADRCRECRRIEGAEYRKKNPNKNKEDYHKRISENPNYWADYYAANRESELKRVSDWQKANPEIRLEMHRRFRQKNPDYYREYELRDPEATRAKRRRQYEKKKDSPRWKVENTLKVGIHKSLGSSKAGRSWESLVGYTADELMRHLEKQFLPGMDWTNYGRGGWHIDHIIPRSAFNYETTDDIDFKRCWALENLQPLWEIDNIKKGAKIPGSFQPSLALAITHHHGDTTWPI